MAKHYFLVGLLLTVLPGCVLALLQPLVADQNLRTVIVLSPAVALIAATLPEPLRAGRRTACFILAGVVLGATFLAVTPHRGAVGNLSPLPLVFLFLANGIVTPYYEECVVRRLLFLGAARWIGCWLSALLMSALFGLAHKHIVAFAGLFSLGMCYLTSRGVTTFNRAALHGAFNVTVAAVLLAGGT